MTAAGSTVTVGVPNSLSRRGRKTMSTTPRLRGRLARVTAGLAAVAALSGLGAGVASADSAPASREASLISCWYEYGFTRIGNTVVASAFKDCVNKEVPQGIPVSIQAFYYDDQTGQPSGWFTWKSGVGNVSTNCIAGFPMWFRHSITKEVIYC
jgi:hypothetical protein